jgi:glycosyltransferase involved in cell wall biosynthesis
MKVAFLTHRNIFSPSDGLSQYCMARAIQEHVGELVPVIYPPSVKRFSFRWFLNRFTKGAASMSYRESIIYHGEKIKKLLHHCDYDVLFAPMGSELIAELNIDKPIVYLSDSTYKNMNGYYFPLQDEGGQIFQEHNEMEEKAYHRAGRVVLSNKWAYDSVIQDYKINPEKLRVVFSGPNLDRIPKGNELTSPPVGEELKILMLGRDWERKGGQYGLDLIEECKKAGIPASLTILGMVPPVDYDKSSVKVYPFLDKAKEQDFRKMIEIFQESHFLLFPSRAECHGLATNEANAMGVPVMANRTGGIPDYIIPGVNGDLLDPHQGADAYLKAIMKYYSDGKTYEALRQSSRDEYENRLNWNIWGETMKKIFEELL